MITLVSSKFLVCLLLQHSVSTLWPGSLVGSLECGIFGFCLLSFPQNERKIYKLRQLSLSQFVYFLSTEPTISKKVFCKSKQRWLCAQKYTNWDKLICLSLYIFLSFWGNERRQQPNIPHLRLFIRCLFFGCTYWTYHQNKRSTVVCILVRMKSFLRFWRNHP